MIAETAKQIAPETSDERKTAAVAMQNTPPSKQAVRIEDAASIRAVLRSAFTRQAGFGVELIDKNRTLHNPPVVFSDGEHHRRQRSATARFFSPKVVSTRYRPLMETLSEDIVGRIRDAGQADLGGMTMELAVGVAADIVGLTNSDPKGLARRLDAVFRNTGSEGGNVVARALGLVWRGFCVTNFVLRDLRPAIKARRKQRSEDVISHLLDQDYSEKEILTECLTYAAAGMVTTREFIVVAAWHMIDRPELRERFLAAGEPAQIVMLEEILRAEPVVGIIARRTTDPIDLPGGIGRLERGELVELDVRSGNGDASIVGAGANRIDFDRSVPDRHGGAMFSFGDGVHRCPGAAVAMFESAVFLDRLLRLPGLRLLSKPGLGWADVIKGYEIDRAVVCCDHPVN